MKAGGPLEHHLRQIRKASSTFVSAAGPKARNFKNDPRFFFQTMWAYREAVGSELRQLIELFNVDVSPELMAIVPYQDISWLPNSELTQATEDTAAPMDEIREGSGGATEGVETYGTAPSDSP